MVLDTLTLPALFLLLSLLADSLLHLFPNSVPTAPAAPAPAPKTPRPLRPRTPDDCPTCRRTTEPAPSPNTTEPAPPPTPEAVPPWRGGKRPRGRPKTINTAGYACPYLDCKYHDNSDAQVHALVAYGHHGSDVPIQDFFCQVCKRKFSARRHTPLYWLKTPATQVAQVLTSLAEGLSVSGAVATFHYRERTITTWLVRAGAHGERMPGRFFRTLQLLHVQLDELRTTLRAKGPEVWVWVAYDVQTKVIAAARLGPRTSLMVTTIGM